MKRALLLVLLSVLGIAIAWGALVLLFAGPLQAEWANASLAAAFALGSLTLLIWLRPLRRALAICTVGLCAILVWWSALQPSNTGDWQPDVARLSWAEIHGGDLTFHNIRNFDYRTETHFIPRYEDRTYDLAKLRATDIFFSHWGLSGIAHTIISWDFAGTDPLAISIETRRQKGQQYSAVKGFFRQYEIIYVAGDERDIIRLRTNYRGEDVYLYRLRLTPEQSRALLMDYVATMNALVERPEFYNALVDNCTTSIHDHVQRVLVNEPRIDWRLFANGYGDEMLYEYNYIDTSLPFAQLRERSHIDARAQSLDQDAHFSQGIRDGLLDPTTRQPGRTG